MYNRLVVFKFLLFLLPFFRPICVKQCHPYFGLSGRNSFTFMSNVSTDWFLVFARVVGEIWVAKNCKEQSTATSLVDKSWTSVGFQR